MTYDYIEIHKIPGHRPISEKHIFGKTKGEGVKLTHPAVLG